MVTFRPRTLRVIAHNRVIFAVGEHICTRRSSRLGIDVGIGVYKPSRFGIVVAGLEIIEFCFLIVFSTDSIRVLFSRTVLSVSLNISTLVSLDIKIPPCLIYSDYTIFYMIKTSALMTLR